MMFLFSLVFFTISSITCFISYVPGIFTILLLLLVFKENLFILFIYFWLRWVFVAAWAFSSCGEQGLLFVAVHGLLIAVASLVAEHGLQTCRLQ